MPRDHRPSKKQRAKLAGRGARGDENIARREDRGEDADGKSTISETTHGNIGQRGRDAEPHEIHPDDHDDEGE